MLVTHAFYLPPRKFQRFIAFVLRAVGYRKMQIALNTLYFCLLFQNTRNGCFSTTKVKCTKTSDNKSVINNNERFNLPFLTRIFISLYYPSSISTGDNTGFLSRQYKLTSKKDLPKCLSTNKCLISFLVKFAKLSLKFCFCFLFLVM